MFVPTVTEQIEVPGPTVQKDLRYQIQQITIVGREAVKINYAKGYDDSGAFVICQSFEAHATDLSSVDPALVSSIRAGAYQLLQELGAIPDGQPSA